MTTYDNLTYMGCGSDLCRSIRVNTKATSVFGFVHIDQRADNLEQSVHITGSSKQLLREIVQFICRVKERSIASRRKVAPPRKMMVTIAKEIRSRTTVMIRERNDRETTVQLRPPKETTDRRL